jgi:ribonuclease HII
MTKVIIGVDEVGCGALAGPLVVAAVAFTDTAERVTAIYRGLRSEKTLVVGDSKSLKEEHREVLARAVEEKALATCIIERSNKDIDARLLSVVFPETVGLVIARVLEELKHRGLGEAPEDYLVMIDGDIRVPPNIPCPYRTVVDGDKRIWQIGAASVIAKVKRDERMLQLHEKYPDFQFDKNKGYPVPAHKKLLGEHGPSPVHRRTFRPVAEAKGLPEGFEV